MFSLLLSVSSANGPKELCDAEVTEKQLYEKVARAVDEGRRGKIHEDVAVEEGGV